MSFSIYLQYIRIASGILIHYYATSVRKKNSDFTFQNFNYCLRLQEGYSFVIIHDHTIKDYIVYTL